MKRVFLILAVGLQLACMDKSPTGPNGDAASESALKARLLRSAPQVVPLRTPIGPPIRFLRVGSWGSPQSSFIDNRVLTVTASGSTLRSECSSGVIEEVIVLDSAGHFDVPGTYLTQAGPCCGQPRPARYAGSVAGDVLTFTILVEASQTLGPYTLTFGQVPRIGVCPIV